MENEESGKLTDGNKETNKKKNHYVVLYTRLLKQWNVTETLRGALPEGKGEVFYPCVEFWWHGENRTKYKALFPGYVFIRSDMEPAELHDMIRRQRKEILSFVKELSISEKRLAGEDAFGSDGIIDLNEDEAEFFDMLLGFQFDADLDRRNEEAEKAGKLYIAPDGLSTIQKSAEQEEYERRRKKRLPEKGVVQISFGYKEKGRIVVMDGPLRGNEKYIKDYKVKDQKAYLNITVAGQVTKAGLILLGKKVWYPKDKDAPDLLPNGTAIDCKRLAEYLNGSGIR